MVPGCHGNTKILISCNGESSIEGTEFSYQISLAMFATYTRAEKWGGGGGGGGGGGAGGLDSPPLETGGLSPHILIITRPYYNFIET